MSLDIVTVWDMLLSDWITESLCKSEVDNIDLIAGDSTTVDKEVVGFDITVDKATKMNSFNLGDLDDCYSNKLKKYNRSYQRVSQKQNDLQTKLPVAAIKEILQRGTKEVENKSVVFSLSSKPVDMWYPSTTGKSLVDFVFTFKVRVRRVNRLQLDSYVLSIQDIDSIVNFTWGVLYY